MKKLFVLAAIVIAAAAASAKEKAVVVNQDTIKCEWSYSLDTLHKTNSFGEVSIKYRVVINAHDSITGPSKSKTMAISKATYADLESGSPLYLVFTTYEDGSERITKAITK